MAAITSAKAEELKKSMPIIKELSRRGNDGYWKFLTNFDAVTGAYSGAIAETSITSITGASFTVDSDNTDDVKLKLATNTSADGNYTLTITPITATWGQNSTLSIPDPGDTADTFVLADTTQTLTNKTLTEPIIGSFANATHTHTDAASGGVLTTYGIDSTTASTFTVDSDSSAAKLALSTNAATGAFTATIVTPNLSADATITLPASTGTLAVLGANTFTGTQTVQAITAGTGAYAFSYAASSGAFTTSTGTNTLSGNVVISGSKTLTTGTGAATLKGSATFDTTKTLTFGSAAAGTGTPIVMYSATAANGSLSLKVVDQAGNFASTLQTNSGIGAAATYTLPSATCTLPGLGLANTFTTAQVVSTDDTTDGVVDLLTLKHTSSDNNATAGDGVGIAFHLENATGTSTAEEWASIDVLSAVITNGSEDADIVIKAMLAGTVTTALTLDASDEAWVIGASATNADGINGLRIYPQTASKGSLLIRATANTGDDVLTITNAAQGQATTLTIPDGGSATAAFLLDYGNQTINGTPTLAGGASVADDYTLAFGDGSDAALQWQTADANAECLAILLGDPAGNVVPAAVFGATTATEDVDLGFFNGITQPTIALIDADADSYLKLDWSADDVARITPGGAATALGIGATALTTTLNGVVKGEAEGYMTHTLVVDVTAAEINTGHAIVTCPSGRQLQMVDCTAIAYGAAVADTTTVDVIEETSGDKLVAFAQASLTQSAVLRAGGAGATVLADGASFTAQTVDKDIQVSKTGAAVTGATGVRFIISYIIL